MGKLGQMTLQRWFDEGHFGKRVFLDGVDITDRCRSFDDQEGIAVLLKEPIEIDEDDQPEIETRQGHIVVKVP